MANTVTHGSGVINIVPDGTTDFDIRDYFSAGLRLLGTFFVVSNTADVLKVRSKTTTGPFIIPSAGVGTEAARFDEGLDCFPYIKAADCTFTTPASCLIILYFL